MQAFFSSFTRKGFVSQPVQRKTEELFTTYALRSDQCLHPTAARCLTFCVQPLQSNLPGFLSSVQLCLPAGIAAGIG